MSSAKTQSKTISNKPTNVLVMGVSGSGKSTVGIALARAINGRFIDGDDLHPEANIAKMQSGQPLNDDDRAPWLEKIAKEYANAKQHNESLVIACSALKLSYREILRASDSNLITAFIDVNKDVLLKRMQERDHFMPPVLLQSQLDTLETPMGEANTIVVSGNDTISVQIQQILRQI
ncbi:MAG: AAA family ATPase [Alteromonadaceae bacterium]|nr:AAA family ATPase [Alteromonadaceae bacterium]